VADDGKRQRRIFPQISLYLPDDILEEVDGLAMAHGKKRAFILRELIAWALRHLPASLRGAA
jgi:predicted DNA-binding protein